MQQLPDESIMHYWARFLSIKDKIPDYLEIAAFQRGCKDKDVSNSLARRCVQTLPELSDLVSRFCAIEVAWLAEENTNSIYEDYLRRHESVPQGGPRKRNTPSERPRKKKKSSVHPGTTLEGFLDKPCLIHAILINSCPTHSLRDLWVLRQVVKGDPPF